MELFFEQPNKSFTIREISKQIKIPTTTIQRYLTKLKKQELITKDNKANLTEDFKNKKILFILNKIYDSELIEFIQKKYSPSCIILFGSTRKGEYEKGSDIDIFVETTIKKEIDLKLFEKKLKHNIQLFTYHSIGHLQENLFKNVINGIKLKGYINLKGIIR